MEELRSEIRAAFEKEQAGHAPAAALRRNLVDAVAAQQRPRRSFQWVAVAAAVLLAVLVVAGLLSTRLLARHANVTSPHVTPSPLADYGPPPAGVPLLYVHDPNHLGWLIGYDWSGHPRATVKPDQAGVIGMAPDGQSFAVGQSGGTTELRDRLGQPIPGSGALPAPGFSTWADDNVHTCGMSFDTQALTYSLNTVAPGEAVKSFVEPTPNQVGDQEAFWLQSCSFRNDRAIIVRGKQNGSGPFEVWVAKVSDGKLVSRTTYAAGLLWTVIASGDAVLIAESSGDPMGQLGPSAPRTTIRKVSDGSVVTTLDPSMGVLQFSSDNLRAFVGFTPWIEATSLHVAVIDLVSGATIWSYNGPNLRSFVAQPGGHDFALRFWPYGTRGPEGLVMIVHGDGTTTQLPGRLDPTW